MRKTKYIYLLLLPLLVVAGCKELELPPSLSENPVFSIELTWEDGSILDLSAGENRYYLFTGAHADSLDVFEFYGRFGQLDCLNECEPSFAIYIRDEAVTPSGAPGYPEFIANEGQLLYRSSDTVGFDTLVRYRVQFESTSLADPAALLFWIIDDTITSFLPDPELVRAADTPFSARLQTGTPASGCYSRQFQTVRVDNTPGFSAVINSDSNSLSLLHAIPVGGQPPFSYLWNNGDTTSSMQVVQPGIEFCVSITDATGAQSTSCVVAPFAGTTMCVASFVYQSTSETEIITVPGDSLQFKTVTLEYTDSDGTVYRSDRQPQPPGAYFIIDEAETFETNENGDPTLLIKARFSGTLFSENGTARKVDQASVVMAIAYY